MGKSETAKMFVRLGIPVYDADAAVHTLYSKGGAAVAPVGAMFAGVVKDGAIDRQALGGHVLSAPEKLRALEAIVHPLVADARNEWLKAQAAHGAPLVVLDIPLLYESGGEGNVDAVLVVSAAPDVQRERVLARPGMTPSRFEAIMGQQVSDEEKRRRADFVVATDRGLEYTFGEIEKIVRILKNQEGSVWQGEQK